VNISTSEKVWQGNPEGFQEQLEQARALERQNKSIEAYVLYATACYSHYSSLLRSHPLQAFLEFRQAKRYARLLGKIHEGDKFLSALSHGQCDIIGTILLRRWLWLRADPKTAMKFLYAGLDKSHVPAHSVALMIMGIAEGNFLLGKECESEEGLLLVLTYRQSVEGEPDVLHARRQFCRVLRRAFGLHYKLGHIEMARDLHCEALECSELCESKDQFDKIQLEWKILHWPKWVQALLPH